MASTSRSPRRHRRGRRTTRQSRTVQSALEVDDDSVVQISVDSFNDSCIDLTTDVSTDWIDLTRSTNNIIDSPVVVLTPTDAAGPIRRRRGSGRRGTRRSGTRSTRPTTSTSISGSHSGTGPVHVLTSDDSDSDSLPEVPFEIPERSRASNRSLLSSPEGVKVCCPVCLDDTKQIGRTHRQIMSTICGHIFCNVCIKTAIDVQRACPTCRKTLTKKNIHPLFL